MQIYLEGRLKQLLDRCLRGLLKKDGVEVLFSDPQERHSAKLLVQAFNDWEGNGEGTLSEFDVYFRQRRLQQVAYKISELLWLPGPDGTLHQSPRFDVYRDIWRRINHQLDLLQMIRFALETAVDTAPIPIRDVASSADPNLAAKEKWAQIQDRLRVLL